jgi:HPt (histidine-containing phosphotransfer) domain-containing protein
MDDEAFYLEMLEAYLEEDKQAELNRLFEAQEWENYHILAHALKSTSLSIGASELSAHAKELELAGKNGEYDFILAHHQPVMEEYDTLLGKLRNALSS